MVDHNYVQIVPSLDFDGSSEPSNVNPPGKFTDHPYIQIIYNSQEPVYLEPSSSVALSASRHPIDRNGSTNHDYESGTKPGILSEYDDGTSSNNYSVQVYNGTYLHPRIQDIGSGYSRYNPGQEDLSGGEYLHTKSDGRRPDDVLPLPPKDQVDVNRAPLSRSTISHSTAKRVLPDTPPSKTFSCRAQALIGLIITFFVICILAGVGYGIYYGVTHQSSGPTTAPSTTVVGSTIIIYAQLVYNDSQKVSLYRSNLAAFKTNFTTQMQEVLSKSILSNLKPDCNIINVSQNGLFDCSVAFNFHYLGNNTYIGLKSAVEDVINNFIGGNVNIILLCTSIRLYTPDDLPAAFNCTSTTTY